MNQGPHVVVIGAGFAGIQAARELSRQGCLVTLVDRHPYNTFQPLLYQVATGGLNPGDVTYSLRNFSGKHRGVRFTCGAVSGIDPEGRTVSLDDGRTIAYDYLVLGFGVTANFFGLPGVAENALPMYTRAQAIACRDAVFGRLEHYAALPEEERATKDLHIVVVGGGATGVEMAGSLAEMRSTGVPNMYPELDRKRVKVHLVEAGPVLLGPFGHDLQEYTYDEMVKRDVDVRLSTSVARIDASHVYLKGGEEIDSDVVIWGAGVGAYDWVRSLGFELGRGGRIVVDQMLRVKGQDRIFAAGDCSIIEDQFLPQLAQPAMQMGVHIAGQIVSHAKGGQLERFEYWDKGTMATIGRNAAVAEVAIPGRHKPVAFTGFVAWLLWVGVHLFMLLGGRNRVGAMINLGFRYIAWGSNTWNIVGDLATPKRAKRSAAEAEAEND
ncbi:NAD(P)/FAD-dependent oxidoreductase [Raineyella fluvialis]|uniref:NADH:ubiquinone reductase (non-electrogenic) n=1 Tax=Raineyella fluvialis TaxID=2662261 RepID=A0A5Q2FHN0_9ACTN|nr:NAD(P)/FAD-dependent oxidoreductase [Raineyella fluvialis]QGF23856.1 FAD-dependent oxidoreductase [Raineyella fluvialis]